jgi:hypothetical protein
MVAFMGFSKSPLPEAIPKEFEKKINDIRKKSKGKEDFLKKSLDFVSGRCMIGTFKCYTEMNKLFWNDIESIYAERGYLPCTSQNHMLRMMLVRSGLFSDKDITQHCTFVDFNVHQYLKVKVGKNIIKADPWFYREMGYNKYGSGLNLGRGIMHAWQALTGKKR